MEGYEKGISRTYCIVIYLALAQCVCKDESLPEETNRRIVDIISDVNLAYSEHARRYLADCGLPKGNFGFASTLLDTLKKHGNKCPVMLSSSIQATLSGRFGTSEYGLSKKAGEELFFSYGEETGAKVLVYRFPNLVGKWVRPNYNSAVGTFCNNIANDLPITVNDPSVELEIRNNISTLAVNYSICLLLSFAYSAGSGSIVVPARTAQAAAVSSYRLTAAGSPSYSG